MARGGKRPGAGRKKGYAAKSAEEARKVFAELISKEIEPIVKALIKKAKKGDIRATSLLLDRAFGKPAEEPKRFSFSYNAAEIREKYKAD